MITEINDRKSQIRTAPIMAIGCGLLSLLLLGNGFEIVGVIAGIATVVSTILAAHYDRTRRITFLHYDLENEDCKFVERQRICQILSTLH